MRFTSTLLFCVSLSIVTLSQDYSSFTETINKLHSGDSATVWQTWNDLVRVGKIPLVVEDTVAFFYRGEARSVQWMGDFNGWGYHKNLNNKGVRIPNTDIWVFRTSFPKDARLDYKIVVNESNWVLDPYNNAHQWSGVGGGSPNSEIRMPEWKEDPLTTSTLKGVQPGRHSEDLLFDSKALGYQITYSIYLPFDYKPDEIYPVIYVTDGNEYVHERLGNMIVTLDNLIYLKKIKPIIAVFIDHREPVNRSNNRRMTELAMNEKYLNFLTDELLPALEKKYSVSREPASRAILGTSMGGLSAAYFAFTKPDLFGLAGIQSPAFYLKPDIYKVCDNPEQPPVKTFLTTGTINDVPQESINKMKALLDRNTCTYQLKEVNQGHSWGNWRDLIDDILIYFFPVE